MLKNYQNVILIFLILAFITVLISLIFIDLGEIEKNPRSAYMNRAGLIFMILANTNF